MSIQPGPEALKPRRVRHEAARRRELIVAAKDQLAPHYLSIRFSCDDFADFVSLGPDDHVKVIIGGEPGPNVKPPMRDYTPRAFDAGRGTFVLDFALHDNPGPATSWAINAQVGDRLSIGGPRGSTVLPDTYDWYWLIGDETAIPAILRRLAEWPDQTIRATIAVAGPEEELDLLTRSPSHDWEWVHRPPDAAADPSALLGRIAAQPLPAGTGFVWIASEASVSRALRQHFAGRGHPEDRMKASGYWTVDHAGDE